MNTVAIYVVKRYSMIHDLSTNNIMLKDVISDKQIQQIETRNK